MKFIKMLGFNQPHYRSRILKKGIIYRVETIHGGVTTAKKLVKLGLAEECKDGSKATKSGLNLTAQKEDAKREKVLKEKQESEASVDTAEKVVRKVGRPRVVSKVVDTAEKAGD